MTECCSCSVLYSPLPDTTEPYFLQPPLPHFNCTHKHARQHPTISPFFSPPDLFLFYVFSKHFCFLSEPPKKQRPITQMSLACSFFSFTQVHSTYEPQSHASSDFRGQSVHSVTPHHPGFASVAFGE